MKIKKIKKIGDLRKYDVYKKFWRQYGKDKHIPNEVMYYYILKKIGEEIGNLMLDEEDGVFIKGLGYFVVIKFPFLRKKFFINEQYADASIDRHLYSPTLITEVYERNNFANYITDFLFYKDFRKRLSEKIKQGHKYVLNYDLVDSDLTGCSQPFLPVTSIVELSTDIPSAPPIEFGNHVGPPIMIPVNKWWALLIMSLMLMLTARRYKQS